MYCMYDDVKKWESIQRKDRAARNKGTLIGRYIEVDACDVRDVYVVESINQHGEVLLRWELCSESCAIQPSNGSSKLVYYPQVEQKVYCRNFTSYLLNNKDTMQYLESYLENHNKARSKGLLPGRVLYIDDGYSVVVSADTQTGMCVLKRVVDKDGGKFTDVKSKNIKFEVTLDLVLNILKQLGW